MENGKIATARISKDQFEKILEKQKQYPVFFFCLFVFLPWTKLSEGSIYKIVDFRTIKTKHGESSVITLSDNSEVWAPSALSNRLEWLNKDQLPFLIRPSGKKKSEATGHLYWDFDLVVNDE